MAKTAKVHIIGAGLSGMIAAYNLAKEGYDVLVLEKYGKIGGSMAHHPSNHGTPMAMDYIWDYIGIDLSEFFIPSTRIDMFIYEDRFSLMENNNFICERGPRKTAVDRYLYDKCIEVGVKFEFNQDIKDPFDMPDPTIIATGLHKDMQAFLHRPMTRLPIFASRRNLKPGEMDGHLYSWMGNYTRCYGYSAVMNDLQFINFFSDDDLTLIDLKNYQKHIEKSMGFQFDNWNYCEVYAPTAGADAPQLFVGSKILAGSLAGTMCPIAFFGIHGALVSGKIAAMAVYDPEKAEGELKRMTSDFQPAYKACVKSKRVAHKTKLNLQRQALKHPLLGALLPKTNYGIAGLIDQPPGPAPKFQGRI
jgi:flavin-dependent dehydrogenase